LIAACGEVNGGQVSPEGKIGYNKGNTLTLTMTNDSGFVFFRPLH